MEMDEYFLGRLKPVVISGGEVVENLNHTAEMIRSGSSPAVMDSNSLGVFSRGGSPTSPPTNSDTESVAQRRASKVGRSVTPIPPPINTAIPRMRPAPSPASSFAGSCSSSRKQSFETQSSATSVSAKPRSRWNFFHKSKPTPVATPRPSTPPIVTPVPMIPRSVSRRNVPAHYAPVMDQEEKREAQELVEQMRQKRNGAPPASGRTLRKQQSTTQFMDTIKSLTRAASPSMLNRAQAELSQEKIRETKVEQRKASQQAGEDVSTLCTADLAHLANEHGLSNPLASL